MTIIFQAGGYDDITIQARPMDGVRLGNIAAVLTEAVQRHRRSVPRHFGVE